MSKPEKIILTNMCMVYDDDGNILVQNRTEKSWPGIAFPGGHIEANESFVESVIREVWEETGLKISDPQLCGLKQWYTENDDRYIVMLFKTNKYTGTVRSSEEGEIFWIKKSDIHKYKLANDFDVTLKVFLSDELNEQYCYKSGDKYDYRLL